MPIIPVTKIVTPPSQTFSPLIYEMHITDIFDSTIVFAQDLPIITINQPLTLFNSQPNLIDQISPVTGIAENFRMFIVSNNTTKDFQMEMMNNAVETIIFPTVGTGSNVLFLNPAFKLPVVKGDVLHYHFETKDQSIPTVGKVVMGFITFEIAVSAI